VVGQTLTESATVIIFCQTLTPGHLDFWGVLIIKSVLLPLTTAYRLSYWRIAAVMVTGRIARTANCRPYIYSEIN